MLPCGTSGCIRAESYGFEFLAWKWTISPASYTLKPLILGSVSVLKLS